MRSCPRSESAPRSASTSSSSRRGFRVSPRETVMRHERRRNPDAVRRDAGGAPRLRRRSGPRSPLRASESIGHPLEPDPPLSKQGESWLRRMRSALCDTECTTASVVEMDKAMHEALSEAEDEQIHSRLIEFEAIRDGIPLAASNAEQALPAVLERIRQMAEA